MLPGDSSWIRDARYLEERFLGLVADAASHAADGLSLLPAGAYRTAAGTIGRLAAGLPPAAENEVHLLPLPAWELEAPQDVLLAFRRAQAG